MDKNAEQIAIMQRMCLSEVEHLQLNLKHFIANCLKMQNDANANIDMDVDVAAGGGEATPRENSDKESIFSMVAFDECMSELSAVSHRARKFNIYFQLRKLGYMRNSIAADLPQLQSHLFDCSEYRRLNALNSCKPPSLIKDNKNELGSVKPNGTVEGNENKAPNQQMNTLENIKPPELPEKTDSEREKDLLMKMLNENINPKDLSQFIPNHEFSATITSIYNLHHLIFYIFPMNGDELKELINSNGLTQLECAPIDKCFGLCISNGCVLRAKTLNKEGTPRQALLIDIGEVIPLEKNCTFFELPQRQMKLQAQAIKCVLMAVVQSDGTVCSEHNYMHNTLIDNYFKKAEFKVVENMGRQLHLELHEKISAQVVVTPMETDKPISKVSFETTSKDQDTTTADTSQGRNFYADKEQLPCLNVIHVTVTHIIGVDCFYGQVSGLDDYGGQLFWTDEEVLPLQKILDSPNVGDLVLSLYIVDNCWYRAEVKEILKDGFFKVFYIDWGNTEMVPLSCLANCIDEMKFYPPRARRLRFADIGDIICDANHESQQATKYLDTMLTSQVVPCEQVGVKDDEIYVRIVDKAFIAVPLKLLDMGFVKHFDETKFNYYTYNAKYYK